MKLLVKTCCKIIYHVLNKRFKTEGILPCMAINTNFGEIRCSPAPLPEKIDGNVNCRVHRYTWWSIQSDRRCDIADLFSVTSEVEFPENTNTFLSQMPHNPLLTLLSVRLFATSCFDNDIAVESLPCLFCTFEAPYFAVFPSRAEERSNIP